ncbi:MAG: hypothetical protein ACOYJE_05355 [Bacteroidaceae bacterium]
MKKSRKNGHIAVEPSALVKWPWHPQWNGHSPRKSPHNPKLSGISISM